MRLIAQFDDIRKTLEENKAREISVQYRKLDDAIILGEKAGSRSLRTWRIIYIIQ